MDISRKPNTEYRTPYTDKRIFITGGCGFIGSNLVEYLIAKGFRDIKIYDNLSNGKIDYIEHILSKFGKCRKKKYKSKTVYSVSRKPTTVNRKPSTVNRKPTTVNRKPLTVTLIIEDILNKSTLNREVKDYDSVVHLAAFTNVVESLKFPDKAFKVNAEGAFNILEAARRNKAKKFIFASSNAAVGEQTPPINELMVPKPLSCYGATKLFGESMCSAYFHSYGLKTVSLRFANAYGPYSGHKTSVVAKFIRRASQGQTLEIYGDGKQTRDFIHATDISQAIYLCLDYLRSPSAVNRTPNTVHRKPLTVNRPPSIHGETFQIATGIETKIIDLAKMINTLAKGEENIEFRDERRGEIRKNFSDISKARRLLEFEPKVKLEKGLKDLINRTPLTVNRTQVT